MTQTKFFRWTLLLCLSGATSPLAAQGVGEKAKKVEQMQVLKLMVKCCALRSMVKNNKFHG